MVSLVLALLLGAEPSASFTAAEKKAATAIIAEKIAAPIRFLASDALEGRAPGSAGDAKAEQYLVERFHALGLQPFAPDGGWLQPVELIGIGGHPRSVTVARGDQALELTYQKDVMVSAGGPRPVTKIARAEIVFVGYGIIAPEFQWNDFKKADLRGKVLLVMNNDPEDDPNLFAGKTRLWYGRWDYKYKTAADVGAAGAIIIHTTQSAGYPWQVVQTSWAGEQFELPPRSDQPQLGIRAWATEDASRRIVALGGRDLDALRAAAQRRDFQPVPLGVTLSTEFQSEVRSTKTANVIGVLKGSDPSVAGEAVLYTAHHDHLGRKKGAKPGEDDIYNGAVDNASGVAEMLAVAEAFHALPQPPRRSVIFASVGAEEQGLLGSEYLAQHPPIPVGRLAADINLDGANIWGRTRDVTVVGLGKSTVDHDVIAIAKMQNRVVKPDLFPDRGFFYRSDQFSLARVGVPAAYAESGVDFIGRPPGWGREQRELWERTHYHQPSDEFDPGWDLSGAVEDTRLYFFLGLRLANADALPQWTPGDEFEAARKRAQDALKPGPTGAR